MLGLIPNFWSSSYGKIALGLAVAFGLMLVGWLAFRANPGVQTANRIRANFTQEKVDFDRDLTFADSTGKQTERDRPSGVGPGDVEQTITIEDSTGTRRLFVEQTGSWFPEITGRPTASIRGLSESDVRGITTTTQAPPLLGLDPSAILVGGGYSFGGGPVGTVAYTPLQIWAFRFGPSVHMGRDFAVAGAVSVEMREDLYLVGSVTPDVALGGEDKQFVVSITYRF